MEESTIYIKAPMSVQVGWTEIQFCDVFEIIGTDRKLVEKIKRRKLISVHGKKNQKIVFSLSKIIEILLKEYPGVQIVSIGEPDFIVEYKKETEPKKWLEFLKLITLCLIVFTGSAFTIMTFNTDVGVKDVFYQFYHMVTGYKEVGGSVLEISYSLGIFIGIMAFYNHFKKSRLKEDPTPIHVEMRNYEEELNKAVIEDAEREGTMKCAGD